MNALYISLGAASGALLRWWVGLLMNWVFPALPLGTLLVNLVGGFLMGVVMALTQSDRFLSEGFRLALTTGFLGGLTTFSAFSGEAVSLLYNQAYFLAALLIIGHVVGSILMTYGGLLFVKLFIPSLWSIP